MRAINKHIKVPDSIRNDFESWVESFGWCIDRNGDGDYVTMSTDAAWGGWCASHKQYIAQPAQEPVAWGYRNNAGAIYDCISPEAHADEEGDYNVPLYTAPPQPAQEPVECMCGLCKLGTKNDTTD